MSVQPAPFQIATPDMLDSLVAMHVTHEGPEIFWEDAHGMFKFDSEEEARSALCDRYYQLFLPHVNWAETVIRQVRRFRPYSRGHADTLDVVYAAVVAHGPLRMCRKNGRWNSCVGENQGAEARSPAVSICLAALQACGLSLDVDHDRVDSGLGRMEVPSASDF